MNKLFKILIWLSVVVGIFISVLYYRSFLFSPEFNEPADVVISEISETLDIEIPSYQVSTDEIQIDNTPSSYDVSEVPVAMAEESNVHEKTLVDVADSQAVEQAMTEPSPSGEINSQLDMSEIVNAVKETVNEALDVFREKSRQQVEQVVADNASALSASELLFKARLAYWNRDLKAAEKTYIELTEMVDDPNAYGELGNVYYMQSRWKKASDAYYHAAIKLKDIKHIDQAFHLLRIIRGLDTDTADRLQTELQRSS
ncbi:hypothetical protein MNBD_GAMMA11-1504 [hydrothermal vent metagenome]|uniref:Tetratricopeptide repeat protein n=1 Tax=hydrothermal vent metagenome TaxID=652676 RepID=A0A3B0XG61_9ZZZZ